MSVHSPCRCQGLCCHLQPATSSSMVSKLAGLLVQVLKSSWGPLESA